jgi:hypothetical protein
MSGATLKYERTSRYKNGVCGVAEFESDTPGTVLVS